MYLSIGYSFISHDEAYFFFTEMFADDQLFIMFEFADGGKDLESAQVSVSLVGEFLFMTRLAF